MQLCALVPWLTTFTVAVPMETFFVLASRDHSIQTLNLARAPAPVPASGLAEPIIPTKAQELGAATEPVDSDEQNASPNAESGQPETAPHGAPKLSSPQPAGAKVETNDAEATDPERAPNIVTLAELQEFLIQEYPPEKSCSLEKSKREEQNWKWDGVLSKREGQGFTMDQVQSILRMAETKMTKPVGLLALGALAAASLGRSKILRTNDDPEKTTMQEILLMFRSDVRGSQIKAFTKALLYAEQNHPLLAGKPSPFKILDVQSMSQDIAANIETASVDPVFTGPLRKLHVVNAWYDYQVSVTMTAIYKEITTYRKPPSPQLVEQGRRFLGKAFQRNGIRMNMGHLEYLYKMTNTNGLYAKDFILASAPSIQRAALVGGSPAFEHDVSAFVNSAKFGTPVPWGSC